MNRKRPQVTHVTRNIDKDAAKLTRDDKKQNNAAAQSERKKLASLASEVVPKGTFSSGGEALGSMAGRLLGSAGGPLVGTIATKAGGALGKLMGGALSHLVGFGDYEVEQNSLFKTGASLDEGQQIPTFRNVGYATRVQHREFVGEVVIPADPEGFNNTSYVINPANGILFPWLSQVAKGFQQYKMKGMVLEFRTMSSDITAGGALGTVAMATNYNVNEKAYTTLLQMQNTQYATSCKPSLSIVHCIECAPRDSAEEMKYVRSAYSYTSSVYSGAGKVTLQDDRLYDIGMFQLATEGLPGSEGDILGQLWVSYDIELFKPELQSAGDANGYCANGTVGISKTAIWGISAIQRGLALKPILPTSIQILVPGDYFVFVSLFGTGIDNITTFWDGETPAVGQKYDQYNIGYALPGLPVLNGTTTAFFAARIIRSKNGYVYNFATDLAPVTSLLGFSVWAVPISFEILLGGLALYSSEERSALALVRKACREQVAKRDAALLLSKHPSTSLTNAQILQTLYSANDDAKLFNVDCPHQTFTAVDEKSFSAELFGADDPSVCVVGDPCGDDKHTHPSTPRPCLSSGKDRGLYIALRNLFPHHSSSYLASISSRAVPDVSLAVNLILADGPSQCTSSTCNGKCLNLPYNL
jgi:hypothetical protein